MTTTRYALTVQTITVTADIPPEAEDSTLDLYIGECVRDLERQIRRVVADIGITYDGVIPGLTITVVPA